MYRKLGEFDKAVMMYEHALTNAEKLGSKECLATTYENLGMVYKCRGELDDARKMWVEAIRLYDNLKSPRAVQARELLLHIDQ